MHILFQDSHLVVVSKPSGMLTHRGQDNDRVTAMSATRDRVGTYVYPAHRLDRGTSGALAFGLSAAVVRGLQAQLESGTADKRYLALVRGVPPEALRVDHPVPSGEGQPRVAAVTEFRRLFALERWSLLEVRPRTGRWRQIRRHCKHQSHPIVGDVEYGKGPINRLFRAEYGLHRLALHAHFLAFIHPVTGARIEVVAPVPADLAEPLARLGIPERYIQRTAQDFDR